MSIAETAVPTGSGDPATALKALRYEIEPYGFKVGPVGHLHHERERLGAIEWKHFDVKPVGATIGAELSGIDLRNDLAPEVIAELRQALLDYKVIFFRDQPLDAGQHVTFARHFGDLEIHPFLSGNVSHPELVRFAKSADTGGYENQWHADVTWRECPSLGAVLRAVEVPPTGGDTLFSDMYAAYDGLDDAVKERIDGLYATHDFARGFGRGLSEEDMAEVRRKYPVAVHPVVRTHEETGRKLLYLNRTFATGIVGWDDADGKRLIAELCREAEVVEYQCRFRWEPNSIAFWDNRAVQHYACSDYWPSVRVMERASIIGPKPV